MKKILINLLVLTSILLNMNFLNSYLVKNETGEDIMLIYLSDSRKSRMRSKLANNEYIEFDINKQVSICAQKFRCVIPENAFCFNTANYDLENRIFSIVKAAERKPAEEIQKEELSSNLEQMPRALANIIHEYYKPSESIYDLKISKETEKEKELRLVD